jgi:hypothetical protein
MLKMFPSGSRNHATRAPVGVVPIPISSRLSPSNHSNRIPAITSSRRADPMSGTCRPSTAPGIVGSSWPIPRPTMVTSLAGPVTLKLLDFH